MRGPAHGHFLLPGQIAGFHDHLQHMLPAGGFHLPDLLFLFLGYSLKFLIFLLYKKEIIRILCYNIES